MPVQRIAEYDTWKVAYGAATVEVFIAGTTNYAALFFDEAKTLPAPNPQLLLNKEIAGVQCGKFSAPLYTSDSITITSNSVDQTGIIRPPIVALAGEEASGTTVQATGGSVKVGLADVVGRVIYVRDFGEWLNESNPASTATNNTTLTAAISKASNASGGYVVIPAGTYQFDQITLPDNVMLKGQGLGVTILQSITAGNVVTLGGNRAGLSDLTLDGISLEPQSVGIFSKNRNETIFSNVEVKRFETGMHCKGGVKSAWRDLYLANCTTGAKLHGDLDTGGGSDGNEFRFNRWEGGEVIQCTVAGVEFSFEDKKCWNNTLVDVGFKDNTGTALAVNGARFIDVRGCWFEGNTKNLTVQDDTDNTHEEENTVQSINFDGGFFSGGEIDLKDTCLDLVFERIRFSDTQIQLTNPSYSVLALDCIEDEKVTIIGTGAVKWSRWRQVHEGASSGITTDATATKAWAVNLDPGQVVYLEAMVLGNQRNEVSTAEYHLGVSAGRPGSELSFDGQTADFTAGEILTGQTSEATALVQKITDTGSEGTLVLRNIVGTFENNEEIKDSQNGAAFANGVIVDKDAALKGAVASIRAAREDVAGWDATFVASAGEIELRVTGAADTVIEWTCHVKVVTT